MDTEVRVRLPHLKHKGFAIAEVVIAIGLVAIAALIVGGLGQQVLNLAKSSKQTAATIELRTKTNSISRNLDSWLGKMRSSLETNGLYAACIPDPSSATSLFKCPAVDAALLESDSELKRIAGTQLHAVSAPVIDLLGERIAGTIEEPLYLDLDGRKCQQTNQFNCPLKSTGYFLRSNPAIDSTPGSVRFVVKIESNRASAHNKGTAPLRTQYLSIDVGSEWQEVADTCPVGSIKIGYLASGSANCVHPTKKCAAGTVALGLDNSANPICATPPASCVSGGAVVDTASNTLVCSSSSPCSSNQIFLGYYSGTGTPMCSGTNISCPDGQVQVGIQGTSGSLTALCKTLPSCQDSQKLSYDGSQFVCQSASVASTCGEGEVVVGINTDGSAKCQPAERGLASTDLNCEAGKYVAGLESDGTVKCLPLPASSGGSSSTSITNNGLSCRTVESAAGQAPTSFCDAGEIRTGGGCQNVNGGAYFFLTYPIVDASGREGWQCGSGSTGTLSKAHSICCTGGGPATTTNSLWPQTLKCAANGAEIYPTLVSKGIDISSGNANSLHINYILTARTGGNMVFTYNQNTGAFLSLIGQYGQGSAAAAAAEACKQNMLTGASSASCTIEADVIGVQNTQLTVTNSGLSSGQCRLNSYSSQQGNSTQLNAAPGQTVTGSSPSSPNPSALDAYVVCPSNTTRQNCAFESGSGPLGKIICECR